MRTQTYELKNCDLHHALVKIRRLVLYDFDGHDFVSLHILALDHLPEGALTQNIQDEIFAKAEQSSGEIAEQKKSL